MLLSIIIPIYNGEEWIEKCLESIIGQSYSSFEVIVVNDGSTDNSLDIIKKYSEKDKRIKNISTKKGGSASAKNVGLKYTSGDVITFVDADDFIEDAMYETMISILEESNADIVECSCRKINAFGRVLQNIDLKKEEIIGNIKCIYHFMKQENTANYMCNKIYKKELFKSIEFPELCFSEDFYMNAILHSRSLKKVIITDIFYNYVIHSGQCTDNRNINMRKKDGIKAANMVADYLSYDKKLKNYAGLYACRYGLNVAGDIYKIDSQMIKIFINEIKQELWKAISNISIHLLESKDEKKIVCQCILLLITKEHYYKCKWLLE